MGAAGARVGVVVWVGSCRLVWFGLELGGVGWGSVGSVGEVGGGMEGQGLQLRRRG